MLMRIGYAAAIANDLDRDEEARPQVCRAHHWLCLGAGSGHHRLPPADVASEHLFSPDAGRHGWVDI
jgi:hypothetical protein